MIHITEEQEEEYGEYLRNEKTALRNCFMKTRSLPGIPLEDIADVLTDAFSWDEIIVLMRDIVQYADWKRHHPTKGGENT